MTKFNIKKFYLLPTHCISCFVRISEQKQRLLFYRALIIGLYNRDEMCLLRGTK